MMSAGVWCLLAQLAVFAAVSLAVVSWVGVVTGGAPT